MGAHLAAHEIVAQGKITLMLLPESRWRVSISTYFVYCCTIREHLCAPNTIQWWPVCLGKTIHASPSSDDDDQQARDDTVIPRVAGSRTPRRDSMRRNTSSDPTLVPPHTKAQR